MPSILPSLNKAHFIAYLVFGTLALLLFVTAILVYVYLQYKQHRSIGEKVQNIDQAIAKVIREIKKAGNTKDLTFTEDARIFVNESHFSPENNSVVDITVTACTNKTLPSIPCSQSLESQLHTQQQRGTVDMPFKSALLIGDSQTGKTYTASILSSFTPGKRLVFKVSAFDFICRNGRFSKTKSDIMLGKIKKYSDKGHSIVFVIDEFDKIFSDLEKMSLIEKIKKYGSLIDFFDGFLENKENCLIMSANRNPSLENQICPREERRRK